MIVLWEIQPFGDGWENLEPEPVVWLNIAKVEASFARASEHYVGNGGSGAGQPSRYVNIGHHFRSGRPMWMPHLGLDKDLLISFTDGRHRFAWLRDHGATAIPVTTSLEEEQELLRRFGSALRETILP